MDYDKEDGINKKRRLIQKMKNVNGRMWVGWLLDDDYRSFLMFFWYCSVKQEPSLGVVLVKEMSFMFCSWRKKLPLVFQMWGGACFFKSLSKQSSKILLMVRGRPYPHQRISRISNEFHALRMLSDFCSVRPVLFGRRVWNSFQLALKRISLLLFLLK